LFAANSNRSSWWTEIFLAARLLVSFASRVDRVLVYRDFVRLYKQLRGPAIDPHPLLPAARNVLTELEQQAPQGSESGDNRNTSSSATAAMDAVTVKAMMIMMKTASRDFLVPSLTRLVRRLRSDLTFVKDWARLWDAVGAMFALPFLFPPSPLRKDEKDGDDEERVKGTKVAAGPGSAAPSGSSSSDSGAGVGNGVNLMAATTGATTMMTPSPTIQVERLAWKLACVRSHQQKEDEEAIKEGSERRTRLLAACGALAFAMALYQAVHPGTAGEESIEGGGDDDDNDHQAEREMKKCDAEDAMADGQPPVKRVRYASAAETLVSVLHDRTAKATRFGVPHSTADYCGALSAGPNSEITASEIEDEAEFLAQLVWQHTVRSGDWNWGRGPAVVGAPPQPSKVTWLRELETAPPQQQQQGGAVSSEFFVSARQVAERLVATVEGLYDDTILGVTYANDDGFVYDVGTLVELDSLEPLDDDRQARIRSMLTAHFSGTTDAGAANSSTSRALVTPPVYTESMELNEWAVALLNVYAVRPAVSLLNAYVVKPNIAAAPPDLVQLVLGALKAHIVPVVNRVLLRISQEFVTEGKPTTRHAPVSVDDAGLVVVNGELTSDKKFGRAVVALYYHALEAILYCERDRLLALRELGADSINDLLHKRLASTPSFHSALLACCLLCVHKGVGATAQKILPPGDNTNALAALHVCECPPEEYLMVSETFQRALSGSTPARGKLGSPLLYDIPCALWREVQRAERHVLDIILWKGEIRSFTERLEGLRDKAGWPPACVRPDGDDADPEEIEEFKNRSRAGGRIAERSEEESEMRTVSYLFRRVLAVSSDRIRALLDFINVRPRGLVEDQVLLAIRCMLRRHVDLLYDRHLDHLILCCLYGVGKQLRYEPEITFGSLIDAYVVVRGEEEGDITCQRVVRHIKLQVDAEGKDEEPVGNIIQLYNRVFVPRMKDHLLRNASLQRAAATLGPLLSSPPSSRRGVSGTIQLEFRDGPGAAALQQHLREGGSVAVVEIGQPSSSSAVVQANDLVSEQPAQVDHSPNSGSAEE
jgi:hypothetical protein